MTAVLERVTLLDYGPSSSDYEAVSDEARGELYHFISVNRVFISSGIWSKAEPYIPPHVPPTPPRHSLLTALGSSVGIVNSVAMGRRSNASDAKAVFKAKVRRKLHGTN